MAVVIVAVEGMGAEKLAVTIVVGECEDKHWDEALE